MQRFEALAADHAKWSQETFGSDTDRDWTGPLAHLGKELREIEEQPFSRDEWADALLLLLDGSRRAGFTATGLLLAAEYKLTVNKNRAWQSPNDDGSVEHVRSDEAARDAVEKEQDVWKIMHNG
jgi:hypothetical protein